LRSFDGQSEVLRITSNVQRSSEVFLANWQPLACGPLPGWLFTFAQLFSNSVLFIGSRAACPIADAPREISN